MHDCKSGHESLDSLDVVDMKTYLFLESIELFVHLDLQVMSSSLDLSLQLKHFLLLISEKCLPLVIGILLSQLLDSKSFLHFQVFKLFPVVHCLFDPFIDSNQLFIVLHFLEPSRWLDLGGFDCSI